jgi:tetratricopeptide (TPR) repeat protein
LPLLWLGPNWSVARADWQVKRAGSEALVAQAARALEARPEDRALAARLVKLANKPTLVRLLDLFRRRAEVEPPRYAALEAYAQLLLAAGQAKAAGETFARAVAARAGEAPATAAPVVGQALARRAVGDRSGAILLYERALEVERRPAERRRLLDALLSLTGDPADLEHELSARREILRLEPQSDAAALRLADVLERMGRPEEAAQVLDARLPSDEHRVKRWKIDVALRAATLHQSGGADDRAAQILFQLIDELPDSAADRRREVWTRAVEVARRRGMLAELAQRLQGGQRPLGVAEWEALSETRDELGDLEGALDAARRAAAGEAPNLNVRRRIVALLDRLGREDAVMDELSGLARIAPREPRFAIDLIERLFRRGRKEEARSAFDRALARFTGDPAALAQLAELAGRWSEDQRAIAVWTRLRHISPHDEMAILGLGEGQFQRKRRDLAIRTWQALREGRSSKAEGHARLAEVLMEHDLLSEATAEAQQAQALEPMDPRHHRTMAQILERERRIDAAIEEWEKVLAMNVGPTRGAERYEARSRMLALVAREGRARLDAKVRALQVEVRRNPEDREAAIFLAEAELHNGDTSGAIGTLRAIVERDRAASANARAATADAQADALLALVRLLRQTRQLDEAVRCLEELAGRIPGRARDAHIQMADIELARYHDEQALRHAEQAARLAPDNGQALVRIAEVQERAGETEQALASYRRAFARDASPPAAFALSRLLVRRGSAREAGDILRTVLRTAPDEETIAEAGRRAIDVEEYLGSLADFERVVSALIFSAQNGVAYRRLLVDVYRRLLPAMYRTTTSAAGDADQRARMAQHGLRPLLELLTDAEADPERGLVELLGMLGNRDAAPALARLARGASASASDPPAKNPPSSSPEVQLTAVIALGRLSDPRAGEVLEALLASPPDSSIRVASIWALGRVSPSDVGDLLAKNGDRLPDTAALIALGLGRTRDRRWGPQLARSALDPSLSSRARRAAAIALGLSGDLSGIPALLSLLDSGDEELAPAAATALGVMHDPQVVPALIERALMPPGPATGDDPPVLAAIDRLVSGAPLEDEAKSIEGVRLDVEGMLNRLASPPPRVDRSAIWIDRTREVAGMLNGALGRTPEWKLRALTALDSRAAGAGLGRLAPAGVTELTAATAAALRQIGGAVRERVFALLDDPSPDVRAMALRVGIKLGDARLTPARIAAAARGQGGELGRGVGQAARLQVGLHPEMASAWAAQAGALLASRGSWEGRLSGVEILAELGQAGRPALEAALGDPSPFVRSAAAGALGASDSAISALLVAASDPVAAVRAAAARALAPRTTPAAQAALAKLARDPSALVRSAATPPYIEP